jgi:hypothetical protein
MSSSQPVPEWFRNQWNIMGTSEEHQEHFRTLQNKKIKKDKKKRRVKVEYSVATSE